MDYRTIHKLASRIAYRDRLGLLAYTWTTHSGEHLVEQIAATDLVNGAYNMRLPRAATTMRLEFNPADYVGVSVTLHGYRETRCRLLSSTGGDC